MLEYVIDIEGLGYKDPIDADIKDYSPGNNKNEPRYRIHKNKLVLYISKTLIGEFVQYGDIKKYCPAFIYKVYMTQEIKKPPTDPMLIGSYFETGALGEGAGGLKTVKFPKKGRGGNKSVIHTRVDEQITMFHHLYPKKGMVIMDEGRNVQVKGMKQWINHNYLDLIVFMTGEADWITPYSEKGISYDLIICDIKMTGDLTSNFGPFQWADKSRIDMTQPVMYHLLFGFPFAFWIFDYKPSVRENDFFFVNLDTNHTDKRLAQAAAWRLRAFKETVRKVINEIVLNFKQGWQPVPGDYCKKCPIKDCKEKQKINLI